MLLGESGVQAASIHGTGLAITYVLHLALVRVMGPSAYGQFASVLALAVIAGNAASLGLRASLVRFLPPYEASGREALARRLVVVTLVTTVLVGGGVGVLAESVLAKPDSFSGETALLVVGTGLSLLLRDQNRSLGRPLQGLVGQLIVYPLTSLALFAALQQAGLSGSSSAVISFGLAGIGTYLLLARQLGRRRKSRAVDLSTHVRAWVRSAGWLFLAGVAQVAIINVTQVIGGIRGAPEDVAVFAVVAKVAGIVGIGAAGVAVASTGSISLAATSERAEDFERVFARARRRIVTLTVPIAGVVVAAGPFVLGWFDETFRPASSDVLPLMVAAFAIASAVGPVSLALQVSGHERAVGLTYLGVLFLEVLYLILVPISPLSLAVGAGSALVAQNVVQWALLARVRKTRS